MVDTKALNDAIKVSGIKKEAIAKALGISPNSLTNKINGKVDFKSREIAIIKDLLHLTNEDVFRIFLQTEVNDIHNRG